MTYEKPMADRLSHYIPVPFSGCWIWLGSVDRDGYGRLNGSNLGKRQFQFAHRASYELHVSAIPTDMMVLHHCDLPCCINPAHLYLGTPVENGRDKKVRGRARTTPQIGAANGMFGRTGASNPFYGKEHTEETKAKLRRKRK